MWDERVILVTYQLVLTTCITINILQFTTFIMGEPVSIAEKGLNIEDGKWESEKVTGKKTANSASLAKSTWHEHAEEDIQRVPTRASQITQKSLAHVAKAVTRRSNASLVDPGPPPDGGFKAWMQACMGLLVITNTWGMVATFGVFQTYYTNTLGMEPSAVSWIGSAQMLGHFGLGMSISKESN